MNLIKKPWGSKLIESPGQKLLQWLDLVVVAVDNGSPPIPIFFFCTVSDLLMVTTLAEEEPLKKSIATLLFKSFATEPPFDDGRLHYRKSGIKEAHLAR